MRSLLKFAGTIDLTLPIVESAMTSMLSGSSEMLMILLGSKNTINLKLDVIGTMKRYRYEQWIGLLWDRWEKPGKGPRLIWKNPREIIWAKASAANLVMQKPLLDIIHDLDSSAFRLSWEQLLSLSKWKDGSRLLLLILEEGPDMDEAAINLLFSRWDEMAVEALLAFRDVEITDKVIKIVAENLKYGARIMELLLEKEAQVMDLMD
ncbi:hypothetical protein BKA65DRAFT_543623 [Rhexocercosporidium sp. MPI-PUGE-AT-0058]|nr:hypothetical protein BKA65DRAFT_543623 [Rhexocercosporidium sp. MPI-PUGE-AT-0058]